MIFDVVHSVLEVAVSLSQVNLEVNMKQGCKNFGASGITVELFTFMKPIFRRNIDELI